MQNPSSGVLSGTTSQFPSALRASRFYCQILFSLSRGANHSRYHSLIGTPHRWGRGRSSFAAHPSSAPGVLEVPSLGPGTPSQPAKPHIHQHSVWTKLKCQQLVTSIPKVLSEESCQRCFWPKESFYIVGRCLEMGPLCLEGNKPLLKIYCPSLKA